MSFGGPNTAKMEANARVAAAAEKARVEEEQKAKEEAANEKRIADKTAAASMESANQSKQRTLLSLDEEDKKPKTLLY